MTLTDFLIPAVLDHAQHAEEFVFESRDECKSFWKQCIEHHAFFRCQAVKKPPNRRGRMVSKGSSFRYTGRTQKQLIEYVRENYVKMPPFERSSSTGRVFSTQIPPSLMAGLQLNQSAMVVGAGTGLRGDTGVQSDLGPTTRLITQVRPQTDPAQRNHLTDSQLSPDTNGRSLAMGIPVLSDQQLPGGGRQTIHGISIRQRRSCSMASDVPMSGTLPRGAYLLSATGTASSGSYTMNSSLSADSPAQSNSSAGSPQADRKPTTLPDYPAHFVMPSQLRMQDLTLRPLSVASLGPIGTLPPGTVPFTQGTWRTAMSRPASPNPPGVLLTQQPGGRPLGVAVLPTDPYSTMQASLLVNPQSVSQLGGLPVLAVGSSANATTGPNPATVASVNARISPAPTAFSVAGASAQSIRNLRLPSDPSLADPSRLGSARLKLPPGYALLAGTAPGTMGGRIIYIDRNTGRVTKCHC
ncbi:unnamed protein product [Echinostoma caproni]|uniref:FA domain-containing protein n=1 Tax=Echinostoma caproni TaxID=27848 RepID=A0A183AA59_9TREM|nr:unnamed protein product [Echinostoma caproni]